MANIVFLYFYIDIGIVGDRFAYNESMKFLRAVNRVKLNDFTRFFIAFFRHFRETVIELEDILIDGVFRSFGKNNLRFALFYRVYRLLESNSFRIVRFMVNGNRIERSERKHDDGSEQESQRV